MVNLLLIDSELESLHTFLLGVNANTKCVIYSKFDTVDIVKNNINLLGEYFFENVAFVFQESPNNLFVNLNPFISLDNKNQINENESTIFIKDIVKKYSVKTIDFLACNLLSRDIWKIYFDYLLKDNNGLIVRASDDNTGNLFAGGDWILETTNEDIFHLYFNENLKNWNGLLDLVFNTNYCVSADGKLMGAGFNMMGELGKENSALYNPYFEQRNPISNIKKVISNSDTSTYILKNDNTLWVCGRNAWGQLAIKIDTFSSSQILNDYAQCFQADISSTGPTSVNITNISILTDVSDVICGVNHTLVIKNDGSVWGCGRNQEGQLGINTLFNTNSVIQYFTKLNISDVKQISAGYIFTYFLKNDNTLYSCGDNLYGQLSRTDVSNGSVISPFLNRTSVIGQCVDVFNNPITNVEKVSCGAFHVIIKKIDGTIMLVGRNSLFQLGGDYGPFIVTNPYIPYFNINDKIDNVSDIYAGNYSTYIIKKDGTLWACGNGDGLADGTSVSKTDFVQCQFSANKYVKDVKEIQVGAGNTLILLKNGTVWSTGYTEGGRCGIGNINIDNFYTKYFVQCRINSKNYLTNIKQISCGLYTSLALTNTDKLFSCGSPLNSGYLGYLQFPYKYNYTYVRDPVTDKIIDNVKKVLTLDYGILILKSDNTVWSLFRTNNNTYGSDKISYAFNQMKYYDNGIIDNVTDVIDITCGSTGVLANTFGITELGFFMLLKKDRTVWSMGLNTSGQLGLGTSSYNPNYFVKTNINDVMAISGGGSHVLALKFDGTVWGCGNNSFGQLGIGIIDSSRNKFTQSITAPFGIVAIDCGLNHSVILDSMGRVFSCGLNSSGQLGTGNLSTTPVFTMCKADTSVNDISNVKAISCGPFITQVIREISGNTTVYSCGSNSYGQYSNGTLNSSNFFVPSLLNASTPLDNVVAIKTRANNSTIIRNINNNYQLMSVGFNLYGNLGNNNTNTSLTQRYFGPTVGFEGKPIIPTVSNSWNDVGEFDSDFISTKQLIYFPDAVNKNIIINDVTKTSKLWKKPLRAVRIEPMGVKFANHMVIGPILSDKISSTKTKVYSSQFGTVSKKVTTNKPVKIYFKKDDGTTTRLTTDITKNSYYRVTNGFVLVYTIESGEIGFTL
jgi:alpha-tubulin suppressor-like RCC1 family protein